VEELEEELVEVEADKPNFYKRRKIVNELER
jgi:hypothetical protein